VGGTRQITILITSLLLHIELLCSCMINSSSDDLVAAEIRQ
jgi:hypothetical protein